MKLAVLFVLAFLACCLSFPVEDNREENEELQKMLEKIIMDEEIPMENKPLAGTTGDEASYIEAGPPIDGTDGVEEIPKEAEPFETEGYQEIPEINHDNQETSGDGQILNGNESALASPQEHEDI